MMVSGLTCTPSRCCLQMPVHRPGLLDRQVSSSTVFKPKEMRLIPCLERQRYNPRQTHLIRCAMGASYGDNDSNAIFPRMNVKDPYKRLGVSQEASEYEIQSARNFLIQKYAGHKPSLDAIESAHDKIIMRKFYDRKNPKIDMKKKFKAVTQSKVVQAVVNRFHPIHKLHHKDIHCISCTRSSYCSVSHGLWSNLSGCVIPVYHHIFHTQSAEGQIPSFSLRGWSFHGVMAVGNLPNGCCCYTVSTYTFIQRSIKEF